MSTHAVQEAPLGHYHAKNVVKSEVLKIFTLRSNAIIVGLTIIAGLLVTGLVANADLHHNSAYYFGFDPTQNSLTGLIVAALTGGVFGALLITSEYASGTIRASIAATPRRPLLLAAKIGVAAAVTVAPSAGLGSPGALRAVTMTGVFIALMALMSFGFGLIVRSTAGAIAAFVGVIFVLPLAMHGISERDLRYVPTNILTNSIMSTVKQGSGGILSPLSPSVGLLLMAIYATVVLAVGAVLFVRRDA
jgi:ABC-2 type transport system permease protein